MKLTVKRWIADQKNAEAKKLFMFPDVEYVNGFYADVENDTVTFSDVEILGETEKAVHVALWCGSIDGKVGPFKTWFPKSQILN